MELQKEQEASPHMARVVEIVGVMVRDNERMESRMLKDVAMQSRHEEYFLP